MVDTSLALVVLAAGRSSSAGESRCLLRFGNWTALELEVRMAAAAGVGRVVAVIGHRAEEIRAAHSFTGIGIDFSWAMNRIHNGDDLESLRVGLRTLDREFLDAFFIMPADAPLVVRADFTALIEAHRSHDGPERVFIPTFEGRAGHPILCRARMRDVLLDLPAGKTARGALEEAGMVPVEVENAGILERMETREDYRRLREIFRGRSAGGNPSLPRPRPSA